jgi:hypothetical protein
MAMRDERHVDDQYDEPAESDELVLSDVLNHVFDKGVVITGSATISIAGIDLVRLGLDLVISSVENETRRESRERRERGLLADADVSLLPPAGIE